MILACNEYWIIMNMILKCELKCVELGLKCVEFDLKCVEIDLKCEKNSLKCIFKL